MDQIQPNDALKAEECVAEGAAILAAEKSLSYVTGRKKYLAVGMKLAGDTVHQIVKEVVSLPFELT